jgi:hypothetical protein
LALMALLVWWVIWFMVMGSLMSLEELALTVGPALTGAERQAIWTLLPTWPVQGQV